MKMAKINPCRWDMFNLYNCKFMKKKWINDEGYHSSLEKWLRAMKLTMLFILLALMQLSASVYSQQTKLTLSLQNVSIRDVLREVEDQTDFSFVYRNANIDVSRIVSVEIKEKTVESLLDQIFKGTAVFYEVIDKQVVLVDNSKDNPSPSPIVQQQQKPVTGKVTDSSGNVLPGVTVMVKGTTTGIITDTDGSYTMTNIPADAVLRFSFVGMRTQEIALSGKSSINVTLDEETLGIEEVVAVGYGTQKRANVVGAVASVTGTAIQAIPAPDVTNAIAGRLSGTIVRQASGEPGQDQATILIRGRGTLGTNTGPLVVIDGIPGRALTDVDNADIASISILKDASAAIYGASAANGVILVTTKKGQEGKPTLTYQFYNGIMEPTQVPKVLSAGDYATFITEYHVQNGKTRMFSDKDIELYYNGLDPWKHPRTDWFGDLIRNWTSSYRHNVTISGGTKGGVNYYISLGTKGENAIYKQASTKSNQYNLRSKIEIPINDWLKAGIDFSAYQLYKRYPTKTAGDIVGQSTRLMPTMVSFWPNGLPGPDIEYGDNPVVTSTLETGTDETSGYKLQTTFNVTITPPFVKGLTLNAYYNLDVNNEYKRKWAQPWVLYSPDWSTAKYDPITGYVTDMTPTPALKGYSSPQLTEAYGRDIGKVGNININYSRKFGEHNLAVFGAYEQYTIDGNKFDAFRKYYITDAIKTLNAGADLEKTNTGSMSIYARKSWIGRINYSYKERYLAEVDFRRDGSLKFPENNRWGNFPAIMLGWRASEENFWKDNISFINYFKLKASYGIVGMDPGDLFQYYNKYQLSTGLIMNNVLQTSVYQSVVANPNITWEKQVTRNVGFESKWFSNAVTFNLELFSNQRKDILTPRNASVPAFTGLALPSENIGQVDNTGFEVELAYHKRVNSDFSFDLGGNFSYNHNTVVFADEPARVIPWQVTTGHPYGAQLMYNAIGIFKDNTYTVNGVPNYPRWNNAKPGDVIFEDVSGDGKINADDKILIDYCDAPQTYYGITFDATYKNFTLSVLVQGAGKTYSMNTPDDRRGEAGNFFQWNFDDRWTPTHTDATVGRAWDRTNLYWAQLNNNSTYWYSDMAYCRLKNASLTYDIPKKIFSRLGVSRASVSLSGNNLFLIWSAQHNYDPEIASPTSYPAMRTYAIGANITF